MLLKECSVATRTLIRVTGRRSLIPVPYNSPNAIKAPCNVYTRRTTSVVSCIQASKEYRLYSTHPNHCVDKLSDLLLCPREEAEKLVQEEPQLFVDNIDITKKKISLLDNAGIPPHVIKSNLWILRFELRNLKSCLRMMKQWDLDKSYIPEFLPVLKETPTKFHYISRRFKRDRNVFPYGNRVVYLAKTLDCSVADVLPAFIKCDRLMSRSRKAFNRMFDLKEEFKISNAYFAANLSFFGLFSMPHTRKKLLEFKQMGYSSIKLCKTPRDLSDFETIMENHIAEKESDRCESSPKLRRSEWNVDDKVLRVVESDLKLKYPEFFKIRPAKFSQKVKFLFEAGYTPREILCYPILFRSSVDKLATRIKELKDIGIEKPSLQAVTFSEQPYQKHRNSVRELYETPHKREDWEAVTKYFPPAENDVQLESQSSEVKTNEAIVMLLRSKIQLKSPKLNRMHPLEFARKAKLLLNAGYEFGDILMNPRIFLCKFDKIKNRLNYFKNTGIAKVTVTILAHNDAMFKEYLNSVRTEGTPLYCEKTDYAETELRNVIKEEEAEIESCAKFLAAKLGVDEDLVMERRHHIYDSYPNLLYMEPSVFVEKWDILLKAGYTPQELLDHPIVFMFGVERISSRLMSLQKMGYPKPPLFLISCNVTYFKNFMKQLQHIRTKEQNYRAVS